MAEEKCPLCGHPEKRHWMGMNKGKLVWRCSDCPNRQCK
jgi:transposase-like protein